VQLLLLRRTHRRINPALAAATLLTLAWGCYLVGSLQAETHDLKTAKQDAFDSIGAMWRARADAYAAQSNLSLALLDPASAARAEQAFHQETDKLGTATDGSTLASILGAVDSANGAAVPDAFQGYIATELRNITFDGELDAARDMLRRYVDYMAIARSIRDANQRAERPAAVALCLGNTPHQARGALAAFDTALSRVIDINQTEFDHAVDRGFADVDGLGIGIIFVTLITGLAAQFGVAQRLREYSI